MGFFFAGIDDDKVVGLSFSAIAIGLSSYTLWRAVRSERRVRALAFAQRKMEALNLITDGEVASLATQDSWRGIADDAGEADLEDIQQQATQRVTSEEIVLVKLREARAAITLQQSSSMTHDQLVEFIESKLAVLRDLVSSDKSAGENSGALRSFRQQIKLSKIVNEKFTKAVGEIDDSRRAFLQFHMELQDLRGVCLTKNNRVAITEIDKAIIETDDRLKRLGDARAAITAGLARKSTVDERLSAAEDMEAHKAAINDIVGAQTTEVLIGTTRHKIKRLM